MPHWLVELKQSLGFGSELSGALRLSLNLVLGGLIAMYVRELYKRFAATISNRDSFANVFPLLTLTTILVIFVVRSSLALSLGLVGALSIVRFRAAIKEPEELVFLFFCIAIGLALGADHKLLALVATAIVTLFCVAKPLLNRNLRQHNVLLTVSGEAKLLLARQGPDALVGRVQALSKGCRIQRYDVDDGQVQLRAVVRSETPEEVSALVDKLCAELPRARISYVNLESLL